MRIHKLGAPNFGRCPRSRNALLHLLRKVCKLCFYFRSQGIVWGLQPSHGFFLWTSMCPKLEHGYHLSSIISECLGTLNLKDFNKGNMNELACKIARFLQGCLVLSNLFSSEVKSDPSSYSACREKAHSRCMRGTSQGVDSKRYGRQGFRLLTALSLPKD